MISPLDVEELLRLLFTPLGTIAPKSSRILHTLWWPLLSETRYGVRPNWSAWFGSAW